MNVENIILPHLPQVVIITFLYFLLWLALSIVLSLIMTIYIQLAWACPQLGVSGSQPHQVGIMQSCFEFGANPSEMISINVWLDKLCFGFSLPVCFEFHNII